MGWGGFTTHDLARCRLTARMVALVDNGWNIYVRLAEPDKHLEAITSRPLLLAASPNAPATAARPRCALPRRMAAQVGPRKLGRARADRCHPIPSWTDRYYGAVDGRPKMGADTGTSRQIVARGPPVARATTSDGAGVTPDTTPRGCATVSILRVKGDQLPILGSFVIQET